MLSNTHIGIIIFATLIAYKVTRETYEIPHEELGTKQSTFVLKGMLGGERMLATNTFNLTQDIRAVPRK